MKLHVLLLTALPMCLAQFSIQGPSDGNRVAQGLKYSAEKGIEYSDQRASLGQGDFSIQGATDGNTQFTIQGASDGHTDFQIQGPVDGGASQFRIQGATDGHSQSIVQGPQDANHQQGGGRALQYQDPSGLRVNWRSYAHDVQPQRQAHARPVAAPQYTEATIAQPRRAPARVRQHHPAPVQQHQPQANPHAVAFANAPDRIKQLLLFQQQIPYVNSIPEQFRYEHLAAQQVQSPQHNQIAEAPAPQPAHQYRASRPRHPSRQRRQAPQYQHQQRQQYQQQQQLQHRQAYQPPAEPQPQYSPNAPPKIKQLLQFQQQIPYVNSIPEQYRFDHTAAQQAQAQQVSDYYKKQIAALPASPQVQYRGNPQGHARSKRQAPQHQQQQPQYRQTEPPAEPQPHYSTNLPSSLKQILNYQAQIPYDLFANKVNYKIDKPYVPQPVQPAQQAQYQPVQQAQYRPTQQAQYQPIQQAQYQPTQQAQYQPTQQVNYQQQPNYQQHAPDGAAQAYAQARIQQQNYAQQARPQQQPAYLQNQLHQYQGQAVRPVTENQY